METLHLEAVLAAVMFAGLRLGGLMLFAPFLSSGSIPVQIKAGLTVALTALLYPVYFAGQGAAAHGVMHLEGRALSWVQIATGEVVVGLLLGLTLHFILEAAQMAGQILGVQSGFSLVTLFDPQTQADTPVLSTLCQLITLLIFLEFNVHHWLLRGLAASFVYLPPGSVVLNLKVTTALLQAAGAIWLVGLQIAAPVVVATMLIDVTLGFLAKAAPQIPILFLGLSIKTVVALSVLVGTLVLWPRLFEHHFTAAISLGERLLHLAR
jgi:flagellar biosynthesis protein FliR